MTAPLPRWTVLPGDPEPLKRELAALAREADPEHATPEDWPEDPR